MRVWGPSIFYVIKRLVSPEFFTIDRLFTIQWLLFGDSTVISKIIRYSRGLNDPVYVLVFTKSKNIVVKWQIVTYKLYNIILCIARNLLETRENIKIESHPFYPINLGWFSWGWSKKKFFLKKFRQFSIFFRQNFIDWSLGW